MSVTIENEVLEVDATRRFEDGVLTLRLPLREELKPRSIEIR